MTTLPYDVSRCAGRMDFDGDDTQPAVQGEPSRKELYKEFSEWCQGNPSYDLDCRLHTHGGPIDRGGYISNEKTRVAFAAYRAGRLSAPQPAAHQPCPEGIREGAPYDDPAFESLCREHEIWGTAAAAQCAVFWGAGKRVAERKPAPDVTQLVEALTKLCDEIDKHEIHAAISKTSISWFKRKARAVLAAHHIKDNWNE